MTVFNYLIFLPLYNMKSQTDNKSNMKNTLGEISDIREKDDIFKTADEGSLTISKKPLMLAVLLILSTVAVGFVYYKKNNSNPVENNQQKNNSTASQSGVDEVIFQDLDEMVVNLDSKGKENNFLKLKITLEVHDKESLEVIKKMMPKLNDVLLVYLKTLKPSDIKGSIGIYRLREELMVRFNKIIAPAQINDVLFKDFIMQ
ncbi:MAG: flagellar basal body-associated FliL family protein [Candidatus Midichloria sp.]|nr:flagellar basal body-associated FliL family protein [Candidatus Midichloria sp.]